MDGQGKGERKEEGKEKGEDELGRKEKYNGKKKAREKGEMQDQSDVAAGAMEKSAAMRIVFLCGPPGAPGSGRQSRTSNADGSACASGGMSVASAPESCHILNARLGNGPGSTVL